MGFTQSCWSVTKIKPIKVWESVLFQGQVCSICVICLFKGQIYGHWWGGQKWIIRCRCDANVDNYRPTVVRNFSDWKSGECRCRYTSWGWNLSRYSNCYERGWNCTEVCVNSMHTATGSTSGKSVGDCNLTADTWHMSSISFLNKI